MFKYALIVLLSLSFYACTDVFDEPEVEDEIIESRDLLEYALGDVRKSARNIVGVERTYGVEVCRAMENMRNRLSGADRLKFRLREMNCRGETSRPRTVSASVIDNIGQPLSLSALEGGSLYFTDILTDQHILLNRVCSDLISGAETTDTYGENPSYQVRFRENGGKWLQIYEFNRQNRNAFIYSAQINTDERNVDLEGQALFRQRSSACPGSVNVRQLIQEYTP